MKKNDYELCTFHRAEYKNTSCFGNPSYWIFFTDSDGNFHTGYTASNASAGYKASNYRYAPGGSKINLKYHFTKSGECIIDYIEDYIEHNTPEEVPANKKAE